MDEVAVEVVREVLDVIEYNGLEIMGVKGIEVRVRVRNKG
jgi:hypothetical protein